MDSLFTAGERRKDHRTVVALVLVGLAALVAVVGSLVTATDIHDVARVAMFAAISLVIVLNQLRTRWALVHHVRHSEPTLDDTIRGIAELIVASRRDTAKAVLEAEKIINAQLEGTVASLEARRTIHQAM